MANGQTLGEDFFFATWENNLTQNNSSTLKYALMMCIYEALQEEFDQVHYSGNLKNTIMLSGTPSVIGSINGGEADLLGGTDFTINILAMRYDLNVYNKTGQILYSNGSSETSEKKRLIKRLRQGKTIEEIDYEDFGLFAGEKSHHNYLAGSYAEEVDETGGFSGKHKDYVERCIRKGIAKWAQMFPELEISSNL